MLEVRVPISPRPAWINRVRLIAAAIRRWYPDARFLISCHPMPDVSLWDAGWEWSFYSEEDFNAWANTRSEYLATMMDRYKPPFHGDHILMLDADVIPVQRFDELFEHDAIQGVQAHHAPYGRHGWIELFHMLGVPLPAFDRQYSGFGPMFNSEAERYGPPYFNSGVIFGPRHLFEKLAKPYADMIERLRACLPDTYWFDQLGLALALAEADIPTRDLLPRYNFPNRPAFDKALPYELHSVKFLHAMQTDVVHRDRDFESENATRQFVARTDLTGSNEHLRATIASLLPLAFPQPAYWNGEERNFA